jgi:hypothetical protein
MDGAVIGALIGVGALIIAGALRNELLVGRIQGLLEGLRTRVTRIEAKEDYREMERKDRDDNSFKSP